MSPQSCGGVVFLTSATQPGEQGGVLCGACGTVQKENTVSGARCCHIHREAEWPRAVIRTNVTLMYRSNPVSCSWQLLSHYQTAFIPPLSSLSVSSVLLRETEGAAKGQILVPTWCLLLIAVGICFCFSLAPMGVLWGTSGEAHGVGWLGEHMGSADGLCFSSLGPTLPAWYFMRT